MPLYQSVVPLWSEASDQVSIAEGEPLVLNFKASGVRVQVLHEAGNDLMPRCQGVYLIDNKVVAVTCLEHMRGASHHDFRLHIFDLQGKTLYKAQLPTVANKLMRSHTHFFLLAYPQLYLEASYRSPLLMVYVFDIQTLDCQELPIEAPEALRPFYTNAYVSLLTAQWHATEDKLWLRCLPWLRQEGLPEQTKLHFDYPINF